MFGFTRVVYCRCQKIPTELYDAAKLMEQELFLSFNVTLPNHKGEIIVALVLQ